MSPPTPQSPISRPPSSRSSPPQQPRSPPRTQNPARHPSPRWPPPRAKALDVVGKGTKIPGSESVPVYAVVMTGHFISHRGGPPSPRQRPPLTGSTLAVVLDAQTLTLMDLGLSDNAATARLPPLGPLMTLNCQQYPRPR